jgi:hypothetical protein
VLVVTSCQTSRQRTPVTWHSLAISLLTAGVLMPCASGS